MIQQVPPPRPRHDDFDAAFDELPPERQRELLRLAYAALFRGSSSVQLTPEMTELWGDIRKLIK